MSKSGAQIVRLTVLVAIFTVAVCLPSWPGFMSYDSTYALRQARTGIETGGYPPMVSYLWWPFDRLVPGQGGMFAFQNALVFAGAAALGRALGAGAVRIFVAMLVLALAPMTLGPMLVVWKDVSFAGLCALGYACTLRYAEHRRGPWLVLALTFLLLASSFRLNGIAAVLPALAVLAWTICGARTPWSAPTGREESRRSARRRFASVALFVAFGVATAGFVTLLSTWRLPDLRRIDMATGSGWTQAGDLIGISICAGRDLLPSGLYDGAMTAERLERIYHPEHGQLSFGAPPLLRESGLVGNASEVEAAAMQARRDHPLCYLRHRAEVFRYTMGANSGQVFYLTQAGVYPGEADTEVRNTALTRRALDYVQNHGSGWLARSVTFAFLALASMLVGSFGRMRPRVVKALLPVAGAVMYSAGSFFVLPAADARYNFWVNLVFIVTICSVTPGLSRTWPAARA